MLCAVRNRTPEKSLFQWDSCYETLSIFDSEKRMEKRGKEWGILRLQAGNAPFKKEQAFSGKSCSCWSRLLAGKSLRTVFCKRRKIMKYYGADIVLTVLCSCHHWAMEENGYNEEILEGEVWDLGRPQPQKTVCTAGKLSLLLSRAGDMLHSSVFHHNFFSFWFPFSLSS